MPQKGTDRLKFALRVNSEAIKANLMEFHGKTAAEADVLVRPMEADDSPMMLHEEPYVAAFELARGNEVLSAEKYQMDRSKAVELWEKAKAQLKNRDEKSQLVVEEYLRSRVSKGERSLKYKKLKSLKSGSAKVATGSLRLRTSAEVQRGHKLTLSPETQRGKSAKV